MNNVPKAKELFPYLCQDFSEDALDVLMNEYYGSENDLGYMELLLTYSNEFPSLEKALEYTGCKSLDELQERYEVVDFVNNSNILLIDND